MAYRSLLFVPGARPDRFEKAALSGADAICIDLEDAVAPHLKEEARVSTLGYLSGDLPTGADIGLRINALDTAEGSTDLAALAESKARPAFVMIPKASSGADVLRVRNALGAGAPLWPLIETPEGALEAPGIARAVGASGGIMLGGADYSATIGSDMSFDALMFIRGAIINAAGLVGCATMDVPYLDVKDEAGMVAESRRVKAMGFTGRACIHPAQVAAINTVFSPTAEELSKAERIAAAYEEAAGGVALLDGKLIEKPVLRAAQRVLDCKRI